VSFLKIAVMKSLLTQMSSYVGEVQCKTSVVVEQG